MFVQKLCHRIANSHLNLTDENAQIAGLKLVVEEILFWHSSIRIYQKVARFAVGNTRWFLVDKIRHNVILYSIINVVEFLERRFEVNRNSEYGKRNFWHEY